MTSYVEGKSKEEILDELSKVAQPGSIIHEQQKAAIIVRSTQDIETALKSVGEQIAKNAKASDELGKKVFWLNVILTAATVVAAIAAVIQAMKQSA